MLCNLRVEFDSCGLYRPTCKIIAIVVPMKFLFPQLVSNSLRFMELKELLPHLKYSATIRSTFYLGHLESKERLRIQPAQLFNFS